MAFVVVHQKAPGADGLVDVEGFTVDAAGVDKMRHPGQTPVLVVASGRAEIVWASEGKELGQFSAPPVPVGYDPATGAPIFEVGKLKPTGYDPVTGQPIYPKPIAPASVHTPQGVVSPAPEILNPA